MRFFKALFLSLCLTFSLTSCSGFDVTPVSAEVGVGNETENAERNMLKTEVNTGEENHTEYFADTVNQAEHYITEYPMWLVVAFALVMPAPWHVLSSWLLRRRYEKLLLKYVDQNQDHTKEHKTVA